MIYVENSKNQLKIANQYFYFSFGKNYKIDDIETLKKKGPVPIHRRTFISAFWQGEQD